MPSDKENMRRRAEQRRRMREADRILEEKRAAENARLAKMNDDERSAFDLSNRATQFADKDADEVLQAFLGVGLNEVRAAARDGEFDNLPDVQAALKAVEDANKARLFDRKKSRAKRVSKATEAHGPALKKAGKTARKRKGGCAVVGVMMIGAVSSAVYGLYEGASAIIAAL